MGPRRIKGGLVDRLMGGWLGGWICPGKVLGGVCGYIRYPACTELRTNKTSTHQCDTKTVNLARCC